MIRKRLGTARCPAPVAQQLLRGIFFSVSCWAVVLPSIAQAEDLVVIANPKTGIGKLSRDETIDLFLGRNRQLPSGTTAQPLDLSAAQADREHFYAKLTGKGMSEINAYWARLMFTGRATPPTQVRNQEEAVSMVSENRSAVAYVERSKVTPNVKIIFDFSAAK